VQILLKDDHENFLTSEFKRRKKFNLDSKIYFIRKEEKNYPKEKVNKFGFKDLFHQKRRKKLQKKK